MGVGVSSWTLARAVSKMGQLGVVSGTALAVLLARRLQLGDPEGHLRRALSRFPIPGMAQRVLDRYFIPGGKPPDKPFQLTPMPSAQFGAALVELTVLANYTEVFLAKEGHTGVVGINFLEKIQTPTLASLFGAMLAGVDYVLMGAGIPRTIPGILDRLAKGEPVEMKLDVENVEGEEYHSHFDPRTFCGSDMPAIKRPLFLAIISSATLAIMLVHKANGHVDGFVVEGATAGGHNAPPRGPMQLNQRGEPIYGVRDIADLEKIRALERPFWLAGSFAEPSKLVEALQLGAAGVQVGTAFAFCEESGIEPELKRQVIDKCLAGTAVVFTDPVVSPTGFPFKVIQVEGTVSQLDVYTGRDRLCDLGYLRHPYRKSDGSLGYRCPAEPIEDYLAKGGHMPETVGRKCVCNGLLATMGLAQNIPDKKLEPALMTAGDDVVNITRFLKPGTVSYNAAHVIHYLLGETPKPQQV
jgi:nitronate monooxygenase